MSKRKERWYRHLSKISTLLRSLRYVRNGTQLTQSDSVIWGEALCLFYLLTIDLNLWSSSDFSRRQTWLTKLSQFDVLDLSKLLKDCDTALTSMWETGDPAPLRRLTVSNSKDRQGVFAPIVDLVDEFSSTRTIRDYRVLHQFFCFLGRVTLNDIEDDQTYESFKEFDANLRLPDPELARSLNYLLRLWLRQFRVDFRPNHGPGSTADAGGRSLQDKYEHMISYDQMLAYPFARYGQDITDFLPWGATRSGILRRSKLVCVPKTAIKKRTICEEPAILQYFQQMVKNSLYDYMAIEPHIREHVRLDNQSVNRTAARIGSIIGSISTIDLSNASDSVSWDLARIAFRGTPLLPWLYATRSKEVDVNGDVIAANKFAPMGSALCFPVETLIFSAVCEYAMRRQRRLCSTPYYSVYGDDIAISTELVPLVCDLLERLGFTVNTDKTFYRTAKFSFRESCGGEYVFGKDVKPVRIPRWFRGFSLNAHLATRVPNLVSLANECLDHGYLETRNWIIRSLLSLPKGLRPFFGSNDSCLHTWEAPSLYANNVRWNKQLCRKEVQTYVPRVRQDPGSDEGIRYLHYWVQLHLCPDREASESETRVGRTGTPCCKAGWIGWNG